MYNDGKDGQVSQKPDSPGSRSGHADEEAGQLVHEDTIIDD